ncbi:MAG: hypothetical protein NTW64_02755 [Candidatus Omnitrophica bacterium]|nr:hypothetical protein [Candidatus Omnitrophota bacterium]
MAKCASCEAIGKCALTVRNPCEPKRTGIIPIAAKLIALETQEVFAYRESKGNLVSLSEQG